MEYEEMKRLFPNRNVAEQSRTGPNVRDSPFNPAAAGTGSARTTGTEALLPSTNPRYSNPYPNNVSLIRIVCQRKFPNPMAHWCCMTPKERKLSE
jgi:hypothetical protein